MRFSDLQTYVNAQLATMKDANGSPYVPNTADFPVLNPGPPHVPELMKLTPGRLIFLMLGNGSGLQTEGLFDRPFITAHVLGKQEDYADAEALAYNLDTLLLAACVAGPALIGNARALYIWRTGGGPQLVEKGADDRYRFTCTYITETRTG